MKQLSQRQARNCEEAREPICKCRCGGLLHGAKRNLGAGQEFFEQLPEDDPHHVDSPAARREKRNAAKRAETEARFQARMKYLMPAWVRNEEVSNCDTTAPAT